MCAVVPVCRPHSAISSASWISIAPATVLTTIGWFRNGLFSLKNGAAIATPSIEVSPPSLISDGILSERLRPMLPRWDVFQRPCSGPSPQQPLTVRSFTLGSRAARIAPYTPPKARVVQASRTRSGPAPPGPGRLRGGVLAVVVLVLVAVLARVIVLVAVEVYAVEHDADASRLPRLERLERSVGVPARTMERCCVW